MTRSIDVTVVIPARRAAATVRTAALSALSQTMRPRVIVVEDGRADDTAEQLADLDIDFLPIAHSGRSVARNVGLGRVTTPYVSFLDADDYWYPTKLETHVSLLRDHHDAALLYSRSYAMVIEGERREPVSVAGGGVRGVSRIFNELLHRNRIPIGSVVARTAAVLEAGGFDPFRDKAEDWDLWLRMSRRAGFLYDDASILSAFRVRADKYSEDLICQPATVGSLADMLRAHASGRQLAAAWQSLYFQSMLQALKLKSDIRVALFFREGHRIDGARWLELLASPRYAIPLEDLDVLLRRAEIAGY